MGVKNTSIGQLLSYGAIALAGHQAYRYFNSRGKSKQSVLDQDARLDRGLEDTFPRKRSNATEPWFSRVSQYLTPVFYPCFKFWAVLSPVHVFSALHATPIITSALTASSYSRPQALTALRKLVRYKRTI